MKLLFLANAFSPHSQKWIGFFANEKHEIFLITRKVDANDDFYKDKKIKLIFLKPFEESYFLISIYYLLFFIFSPFYLLGFRPWRHILNLLKGFYYIFQTRKLAKNIKPDLVHSHGADFYGLLGAFCSVKNKILTVWGSDILVNPKISPIHYWQTKKILERATCITTDAEHMLNEMHRFGIEKSKIKIIQFGVDLDFFSSEKRTNIYEKRYSIPSNRILIISTRWLEPSYDVETLIRSVPEVIKMFSHAFFIIAGTGSQREYLENLSEQLGVKSNILFIGKYSQSEIPELLASADIYVSTAKWDGGIAASTAEAMASGLPVIISDYGDNSQWVQNGVNGYLFPVSSYKELSILLIRLIQEKDKWKNFGKNGRGLVLEKDNIKIEMNRMEKIYHDFFYPDLEKYWEERFLQHGHTGANDPILYAYDQKQRLIFLKKIIKKLKISINETSSILDAGCGTGDFIELFSQFEKPKIFGIDFCQSVVSYAQDRFRKEKNISILKHDISNFSNLNIISENFNLIIAVNLLMHLSDRNFEKVIENFCKNICQDGYVIVFDLMTKTAGQTDSNSRLMIRSKESYFTEFLKWNCRLVYHGGMSRVGVRLYNKIFSIYKIKIPGDQIFRRGLLLMTLPFDLYLPPCSPDKTDLSIMVFKK